MFDNIINVFEIAGDIYNKMRSGAFYNIIGLDTPIYTCSLYMGNVGRIYYYTLCIVLYRKGRTTRTLYYYYFIVCACIVLYIILYTHNSRSM